MRLGGTVCCNDPAKWEEALAASGFRAVTAPFTCETPREEIDRKLDILREALKTESNRTVRAALMQVVPTYHTPEEVNEKATEAEEMKNVRGYAAQG